MTSTYHKPANGQARRRKVSITRTKSKAEKARALIRDLANDAPNEMARNAYAEALRIMARAERQTSIMAGLRV